MKRYSNDPYWTNARFECTDSKGNTVRKGDRIFYYPLTRTVLTGEAAEIASAEFEHAAALEDNAFNE